MKTPSNKQCLTPPLIMLLGATLAGAQNVPPASNAPVVELSPFVVNEETDQGYYASQTLAGGRLRQDIKNIGSSIQVVTPPPTRGCIGSGPTHPLSIVPAYRNSVWRI